MPLADQETTPDSMPALIQKLPISVQQLGFLRSTVEAPAPDHALFRPRPDVAPYTLTLPVDWKADPFHDRNWCAQLHMFRMTDGHLLAFERTGDTRFLHWPIALLLDWQRFQSGVKNPGKYAWVDKITGHRAGTLAYVLGAVAAIPGIASSEEQAALLELAREHARRIQHVIPVRMTNHTFDDMVGLRALAEVLPAEDRPDILAFVKTTFTALIESQYTADGLHKENSPGYQGYVGQKLPQLIAARWFDEYVDLAGLLEKSNAILRWFRTPDNQLLMIGDTDGHASGPPSPEAPTETGLFQTGGYVIRRDRPAGEETAPPASYFVLMGSAQSVVHKHNDDLSYVWYDGTEIVRETGKFAYKSDIMRNYAMSVRAHNTVEFDECNPWPLLSEPYPAYGNAVRTVEERDGCTLIAAAVRHTRLGIAHARTLLYCPGRFVLVADVIRDLAPRGASADDQPAHPLTQWTHFAPSIELQRKSARAFEADLPDGRRLAVALASDQPGARAERIRGQIEPRVQGWTSPAYMKMEPNDALGFTHQHRGTSRLASLIAIDGRIGKLAWTANDRLRAALDGEIIVLSPGHGAKRPATWRMEPKG